MAQQLVPVVACLAAMAWLGVLVLVVPYHHRHGHLPQEVQEALLVAVLAACFGGLLASLGFVGVLVTEYSAMLASAWRAAVLAAGVYALTAAWRARGR